MLNETDYLRLRETLAIDTNDLDGGLINLPMDQMEIAEFVAAAGAARDAAKFQYDQVLADVAVNMRTADDHISEARIRSEQPLFTEVQDANHALIDAEYDYNMWRGLADAVRSKSKAIDNISELIKAGYMTRDTIRQDTRQMIHQQRIQQSDYQQRYE